MEKHSAGSMPAAQMKTSRSKSLEEAAKAAVVGALIVFGTSYLANRVNTRIAAIFWAVPFTLIPIVIFMKNRGKAANLMKYSIWSSFVLIAWLVTAWLLLDKTKMNKWEVIAITFIPWAVAAALMYFLTGLGKHKK